MADVKEDTELLLEDGEKPAAVGEIIVEHEEKPAEKGAKDEKPAKSVDDVAAELREQLKKADQRAQEAETRARQAENTAHRSMTDVHETNIRLIDSAINTKKGERAAIKKQYSEAIASGEYDAAADLNDKLADVVADLKQLENGKEALKNAPAPMQKRSAADDFIESVRQSGSPRSADWLKARPQYVTDARLHQKMIAAHNIAMADGIAPDTDEYFAAVEQVLGIKPVESRRAAPAEAEEDDEPTEIAAKVVGGRKASDSSPPAAPPSRSAPNNSGAKSNVVRLTAQEREIAIDLGMTEKEYAQNKLALQRAGRMN